MILRTRMLDPCSFGSTLTQANRNYITGSTLFPRHLRCAAEWFILILARQHHNPTTILIRTSTTKLFFLSWNSTLFSYSSVWFYRHLLQSNISSSILSRTSPILDNCKAQSEGVWSWVTSSRLGNWANWDYGRSGRRNSGKYLCLRFSSTYAFVSSQ